MKRLDKDALIKNYIEISIAQGEASCKFDYKRGNKEYDRLSKMYRIMEKNTDLANQMLDVLLKFPDVSVRMWASAHALGLKLKIDEAEVILKEISTMQDIGILRSDAEITLNVWKERGYLIF